MPPSEADAALVLEYFKRHEEDTDYAEALLAAAIDDTHGDLPAAAALADRAWDARPGDASFAAFEPEKHPRERGRFVHSSVHAWWGELPQDERLAHVSAALGAVPNKRQKAELRRSVTAMSRDMSDAAVKAHKTALAGQAASQPPPPAPQAVAPSPPVAEGATQRYESFLREHNSSVVPSTMNRHLPGGEVLVDVRGSDADAIQANYAHEMGHKIHDYLMSQNQRSEWARAAMDAHESLKATGRGDRRGITGNPEEDFPEAFAAWVSGDEWQHQPQDKKGGGLPNAYRDFLTKHFGEPKRLDVPPQLQGSPQPDTSAERDRTGRRVRPQTAAPSPGEGVSDAHAVAQLVRDAHAKSGPVVMHAVPAMTGWELPRSQAAVGDAVRRGLVKAVAPNHLAPADAAAPPPAPAVQRTSSGESHVHADHVPGTLPHPSRVSGVPAEHVAAVEAAVGKAGKARYGLAHLGDVRDAAGLTPSAFDYAVQAARVKGSVTLAAAEGRHGITERDKKSAYYEAGGASGAKGMLLYASLRR